MTELTHGGRECALDIVKWNSTGVTPSGATYDAAVARAALAGDEAAIDKMNSTSANRGRVFLEALARVLRRRYPGYDFRISDAPYERKPGDRTLVAGPDPEVKP